MDVQGFKDTIDWYDANAEEYARVGTDNFDMNHIKTFAGLLFDGAKVLDAGCGPGRDTNLLAKEGLKPTGIDLSKGLIDVARKTHPDLSFVEGTFLELPFGDGEFDGVWSNTSLLHLETVEDVAAALGEFQRVLKAGGILHVVVKAQTGEAKTAIVKDKFSNHDRFFQYFSLEELGNLIRQAGFDVTMIKQYNETETIANGRPEVELIWALGKKS